MKKIICFSLLGIQLLWFVGLWMSLVFNVNLNFNYGIDLYDGFAGFLALCWLFVGVPVSLVSALIYTFKRKYWLWFAAYMVLGGIPVFGYALIVMLSPYFS